MYVFIFCVGVIYFYTVKLISITDSPNNQSIVKDVHFKIFCKLNSSLIRIGPIVI